MEIDVELSVQNVDGLEEAVKRLKKIETENHCEISVSVCVREDVRKS